MRYQPILSPSGISSGDVIVLVDSKP